MKKIKTVIVAALIVAASILSTSCVSLTGAITTSSARSSFRKTIAKQYSGMTPENSTIVFGSGYYDVNMIQQNPEIGKAFYASSGETSSGLFTASSYFVFAPVPVNSELHVYSYTYPVSDGTMTIYGGIAGIDFVTAKPGLYYYDKNDKDHKKEKDSLEVLLEYYKGTEWESIIKTRIGELKK